MVKQHRLFRHFKNNTLENTVLKVHEEVGKKAVEQHNYINASEVEPVVSIETPKENNTEQQPKEELNVDVVVKKEVKSKKLKNTKKKSKRES